MLAYYMEECLVFWQVDRTDFEGVSVMVFNTTFNNIPVTFVFQFYW